MKGRVRARLTHYKLTPAELLDLVDAANMGDAAAILTRCPGGRLIRDGYVCGHCGRDPTEVFERDGKKYRRCGKPAQQTLAETDLMTLIPSMLGG